MGRLNRLGPVWSFHLVAAEVIHDFLQLRRKVTAANVHDVFAAFGIVENLLGERLGGWIRWVELLRLALGQDHLPRCILL